MAKRMAPVPRATDEVLGAHEWRPDSLAPRFQECAKCGARGLWDSRWRQFLTFAGEACHATPPGKREASP